VWCGLSKRRGRGVDSGDSRGWRAGPMPASHLGSVSSQKESSPSSEVHPPIGGIVRTYALGGQIESYPPYQLRTYALPHSFPHFWLDRSHLESDWNRRPLRRVPEVSRQPAIATPSSGRRMRAYGDASTSRRLELRCNGSRLHAPPARPSLRKCGAAEWCAAGCMDFRTSQSTILIA
jgi:hypothetical protein